MKTNYVTGLFVVCLLFSSSSAEAADLCYIEDTGNECGGPDPLPPKRNCAGTCEDDGQGNNVCTPENTKVWSEANKEKTWTNTIVDTSLLSLNPDSEEDVVCWTGLDCKCANLMAGDDCVEGIAEHGNDDVERILTDDWCHEQD